MTLGEKLKRLIADKGWSQNHVIREIGQHAPTFQRWLDGSGQPKPKDLRALSRILSVDIDWLIDDSRGWDDQPATGSQTWLLAQVIEIAGKIGPDEALRRLKVPAAIRATENPSVLMHPSPRDGSGPRPRKKLS